MSRHSTSLARKLLAAVVLVFGALLGLGIWGCSSSDSSTEPPGTGSLSVTITAPEGVTPNVAVEEPGGYQQTVTASGTLSGLAPGSYTVTAASVAGPTGISPLYVGTVTGSPATVSAGATATVSVSYAPQPEVAVLWVGNAAADGPLLVGYTAAQLGASTNAPPAIVLTASPPVPSAVTGVAFDKDGNLWMADSVNNTVSKYTVAQLASGGGATPAVVLSSTSIMGPHGLAFDASGNLWVANINPDYYGGSTAAEFTLGQLASSGAPTPLYLVMGDYCGYRCRYFHTPQALAFDPSGSLWVSDPELERLLMYPPDQLKPVPLGSSLPTVELQDSGPYFEHGTDTPLDSPTGLAFDPAGNLWVSLGVTNRLVEFTPNQLAPGDFPGRDAPEPTVTLSGPGTSLSSPRGLAFDASGNLWVANSGGNSILEFTASQLASSGAPVPNVIVETTSAPTVLAFYPHAANLPLKGWAADAP